MNYFELYPGDYRRDTARLSLAEHGAYLLLMADYYASETPLPAELAALCRIVGAQGKAEQQAVKAVAEQYFPIGEDGLRHNSRADREIAKAQKRINAARENGSKGGRKPNPNKNPPGNPAGNPPGTRRATQQTTHSGEALHTPHAIHQQELPPAHAPSQTDARGTPTDEGRACLLMRQAGCTQTNPSHPDLIAAISEGVTPETLADTVREGLERTPPISRPFTWAIATARGRLESGPANLPAGDRHATPRRLSAVERVRANVEAAERRDAAGNPPDHPNGGPYLVAADG